MSAPGLKTRFVMPLAGRLLTGVLLCAIVMLSASCTRMAPRRVISLNGQWEIAEGGMDRAPDAPARFASRVPVPGLVDMAQPPFAEVGLKSARREAFWYRRVFHVEGPLPAMALLKVHKAMFGTRVILNGTLLGDHRPCFTPGYFDARPALRVGENELLIRVGASREALPNTMPTGFDYEKTRFIPGIYDDVELILTGTPHIAHVQAVPDLEKQSVTVHAWVSRAAIPASAFSSIKLEFIIREASSGRVVGEGECTVSPEEYAGADNSSSASNPIDSNPNELTGQVTIPIRNCRLWSPEDHFLYELETRTKADTLKTRFGMRSFRLDPATGRAMLNGKPYFMRGSNVCVFRFCEDPQRGDKPWREDWVRRLHKTFRDEMAWNALRYCIGFPPEAWYRIADEEGFLIQDEFPIWNMSIKPGDPSAENYDANELASEYAEWMRERWNHPSVVVWDACNETSKSQTGLAIQKVRGLDFSNRPWDNGWADPVAPGDSRELHPYHFANPTYKLSMIAGDPGTLGWTPGKNPIIVNEYGWLWLNRDGTPTTLTKKLYSNLLGPDSTTEQRRQRYARTLAAETEFWRARRACAGVLHFCGLGYSRPDGQTSDHWIDLEKLTWEPEFLNYVRDTFAPVGVMIDAWAEDYPSGRPREFPIALINDLDTDWNGTVRLSLVRGGATIQEKSQPCTIPSLGNKRLTFTIDIPAQPGNYQLEAALIKTGDQENARAVRSLRDFAVLSDPQRIARHGLAVGKPVQASSTLALDGTTYYPEFAVDGKPETRWSSAFSDPQSFAVDLGRPTRIARAQLDWETAHAKAYTLEVSLDGKIWKEVYRTADGQGGSETIAFTPVLARWVRLTGTQRATAYGYSLWEFKVFPE